MFEDDFYSMLRKCSLELNDKKSGYTNSLFEREVSRNKISVKRVVLLINDDFLPV